jgi:hypothetical protein
MIIISGDSWGVGEWGTDPKTKEKYTLTGPGIGQLFSLHGKVINLSEGGCSNTEQLRYFRSLLKKFKPDQHDIFYWIVTDPVRCLANNNNISKLLIDQPTLETAIRSRLDSFLNAVNTIAEQHNININLIGGVCDLDTVDISNYNRLTIKVPSWAKLLDDTYASSIFDARYMTTVGKLVKDTRPELLEEWHAISDLTLKKEIGMTRLFQNNLSDDLLHPNRYGHRILRDLLAPTYSYKF